MVVGPLAVCAGDGIDPALSNDILLVNIVAAHVIDNIILSVASAATGPSKFAIAGVSACGYVLLALGQYILA